MPDRGLPAWAAWSTRAAPWTVGIEEEVLLLEAGTWAAANRIEDVLAVLPPDVGTQVSAETHACVAELKTAPYPTVAAAAAELARSRATFAEALSAGLGLRAAAAGTHPLLERCDVVVSTQPRYRQVLDMTQVLARREPTLAQHVHVAVPDPAAAVRALDGLRPDLPVLLALSANSPYWRAADSGFASVRTPIFSSFPRTGIARAFGDYAGYVGAVDPLMRSGAISDLGYLWWDARLQPRLGTVEVRVMDAQSRPADAAALAALVQCLVRRHAEEPERPVPVPEVLEENRFLAARDGMAARLLDESGTRRPVRDTFAELLARCAPVADELGCTAELAGAARLAKDPGDVRQRREAARAGVACLPRWLSEEFSPPASVGAARHASRAAV